METTEAYLDEAKRNGDRALILMYGGLLTEERKQMNKKEKSIPWNNLTTGGGNNLIFINFHS